MGVTMTVQTAATRLHEGGLDGRAGWAVYHSPSGVFDDHRVTLFKKLNKVLHPESSVNFTEEPGAFLRHPA
jgi:hypothetical protein